VKPLMPVNAFRLGALRRNFTSIASIRVMIDLLIKKY